MIITPISPTGNSFAHAAHVTGATEWLFVSGQVGADDNYEGAPDNFEDQALLAWSNVERRLAAAKMSIANIVKVNVYLADRKYRGPNFEARRKVLGDHSPAVTIVICEIYDAAWLLEIEVVAAR